MIRIEETVHGTFLYSVEGGEIPYKIVSNLGQCWKCYISLDPIYVYIINTLKKKGFLNDDYPLLCCVCKRKKLSRRYVRLAWSDDKIVGRMSRGELTI